MLELVAHPKLRGRLRYLRDAIVTASEGMGIAPEVKLLVDVNACML